MRESANLNQFDQQPAEESADVKLLKRINNLKERKKEIEKTISETNDLDKRAILEFDLEDIKKRISQCPGSIKAYNKNRRISGIEKIAGEENVAEVLDFKREKRAKNERRAVEIEPKTEIPKDIKGSAGPGFLAGLKEFRESRGNEPRPRV
ncbi:hypothetical protein KJ586_03100 [Patescibacteria group bacterium]|nr:hypothetical protein [Patescibacteria group bacterium]MBU4455471.1 hypothetical protein [Patescibacteria group bacterium]